MREQIHRWFLVLRLTALAALPLLAAGQTHDPRARVVDLFQQAQQADEAENPSEAVKFYREIVAIDPGIAEVWSNLGMALYRQDKYSESVAVFERAAALKPSLLAPHLFAGLSYRKMGQAAKAIEPLKAALAIDPEQQEAILALGEAYAQTHQYEAAVRLLQNALKRDPDSESLGSNLAVTYFGWAKDVGNALRHTPNLHGRLLTDTIRAATNSVVAEGDFRATVTFAPDSVEARLALARFLMQNRPNAAKLRMSEEQIEAAKRISPSSLDVEAAEVSLVIVQDDSAKAVSLLQALIQQDPAFTLANLEVLTAGLPADAAQQMKEQAESMAAKSNGSPNSYSSRFAALGRIKSKRLLTPAEDGEYASVAWHLHRYEEGFSEMVHRHSTSPESQYWFFHTCKELGREMLVRTVARHPDSVPTHLLLADFAIQKSNKPPSPVMTRRIEGMAQVADGCGLRAATHNLSPAIRCKHSEESK